MDGERISKIASTTYEKALAKRVMYGTPEEIVELPAAGLQDRCNDRLVAGAPAYVA